MNNIEQLKLFMKNLIEDPNFTISKNNITIDYHLFDQVSAHIKLDDQYKLIILFNNNYPFFSITKNNILYTSYNFNDYDEKYNINNIIVGLTSTETKYSWYHRRVIKILKVLTSQ